MMAFLRARFAPAPVGPHFQVVESADLSRCKECGHDVSHWTIVYPDGTTVGLSWADEILARDICDLMNEAFDAAKQGD